MEKKKKVVSFRLTPSEHKALSEILAEQECNKNVFFRKIVEKLILERKPNSQQ